MCRCGAEPSAQRHTTPPRTWFLTQALSPLAIRLARLLLAHGDYVVACLPPHEIEHDDRSAEFRELINECKSSRKDREGWKDRHPRHPLRRPAPWASRLPPSLRAVQVFGRIDILLCCKFEGPYEVSPGEGGTGGELS